MGGDTSPATRSGKSPVRIAIGTCPVVRSSWVTQDFIKKAAAHYVEMTFSSGI
jgi:hypothetical protein